MKNWKLIEYKRPHTYKAHGKEITTEIYRYDVTAEGETVCSMGSNFKKAALIAAAPEMLKALLDLKALTIENLSKTEWYEDNSHLEYIIQKASGVTAPSTSDQTEGSDL